MKNPDTSPTAAYVLCAGFGKRMQSTLPKTLHPVGGKPILVRVVQALLRAGIKDINIIIPPDLETIFSPLAKTFNAKLFHQKSENPGTAGALKNIPMDKEQTYLIVNGDHPFLSPSDLKSLMSQFQKEKYDLLVGTFATHQTKDYGHILKDNTGTLMAIKGSQALKTEILKTKNTSTKNQPEVNSGIYILESSTLKQYLPKINKQNIRGQEEYPLTDLVNLLYKDQKKINTFPVSRESATGVNTQQELAIAGRTIYTAKIHQLMEAGVVIIDPLNTYIEEDVQIGQGSVIYPNVYLKGRTAIGSFCAIEMNCFIMDSQIGDRVLIRAGSYIEQSKIKEQCLVGPYARLRPGTDIDKLCHIGNFVEIKNSKIGEGSKANHYSYLGDTETGKFVNIGCGAITCNLNPKGQKNKSQIGDHSFIGSGTYLVAPVKVGTHCTTGAGSVITKDIPNRHLAISRSQQINKPKK